MVRAALRTLLACVFALAMLMPAGVATAGEAGHVVAAQQQTPTGGPGPDIAPAPTEQDATKSRQRLVIGVTAIVLLAIVIYGHRVRAKRRKAGG